MKDKFKLAVCQMEIAADKSDNIEKAARFINEAAANGAELVVLPEMFSCPYDTGLFPQYAEAAENGESACALGAAASKNGIYLIAGSIPEKSGDDIYNTSLVFDRKGNLIAKHRKLHLFDIDIPGRIAFKESDILKAGDKITTVETDLCKIGIAICYDIRFPEQFRLMALEGAKLIVVPGAFNMVTGPLHWEPLIRVRAIDNQVYIAAASPARSLKSGYISYANSMVADPWGNIIAAAGEHENILYSVIERNLIEKVRKETPFLKHRRNDVYELRQKK